MLNVARSLLPAVAFAAAGFLPYTSARAASETPGQADPLSPVSPADVKAHASFDPSPELQLIAGGNLVVNAFILQEDVRVLVRDERTGTILLERRSEALFPFEISRADLGAELQDVVVDIYVGGELLHQLRVDAGAGP